MVSWHTTGLLRSATALTVAGIMLVPANLAVAAPTSPQSGATQTTQPANAAVTNAADTADADALLRAVGQSAASDDKSSGLLAGDGTTTGIATIIVQLDDTTAGVPWYRSLFGMSKQTRHRAVKDSIRDLAAQEASTLSLQDTQEKSADLTQVSDVQDYYHVIDGFAIKASAALLDGIRDLPGVKRAFLESKYAIPDETATSATAASDPKNQSSLDMTGADKAAQKGDGQIIAIIDSGLDTDHEAFRGDLDDAKVKLTKSQAEAQINNLGHGTYVSEKIPFARDYADSDDDVNPSDLSGMEHGTHVAGIAAANSGEIRGTAPDAQIVPMKVADDFAGGIYDSALLAALDDSKALDVDTVNMSLGSDAGFSEESTSTYGDAIKSLRDGGATVNVAAGNATTSALGNRSGANLPYATDPDSSVISSPSSFVDSLSVASVNNAQRQSAFLGPDGTAIGYTPLGFATADGQATGDSTPGLSDPDKGLADGSYEYVDGGIGSTEDQTRLADAYQWDLSGKIVVVKRGGTEPTDGHALTFGDKLMNVGTALGAAAVIFYNNADGAITGAAIKNDIVVNIPVVAISGKSGETLIAAAKKTLTVQATATAAPAGYAMSDFTSWGVTPDLKLKPEITAPGGNIWSSVPGDKYEYMSGTSMATPQMSGITAQIHEYVDGDAKFSKLTDAEKSAIVTQLLMSTATPVTAGDSYASPRQQGAGLANVPAATKTDVYLTVDDATDASRPKADLGDSAQGTWAFTLTLHNLGGKARTYTPDAQALSEAVAGGLFQNTDDNWTGKGIAVSYGGDGYDAAKGTVTVPANGTAKLTVSINAEQAFKDFAAANTPNGTFVEGFAMLKAAKGGVDLSAPFVGFYGKWSQSPVFDSALWEQGENAYHVYGTALANPSNGVPLGVNPLDADATAGPVYSIDPERMVVSRTNYSSSPTAAWPLTGLLRNVDKLAYTYVNAAGETVRSYSYDHVSKSTLQQTTNSMLYAEARLGNGAGAFDGKSDDGKNLPDGTYTLRQTATTAGPGASEQRNDDYHVTLDTTAPKITNMTLTGDGDAKTFSFDVTDATWLSAIDFHDPTTLAYFKRILAPADYTTNADGTRTWHFDVKVADIADAWTASGLEGALPNTVPLYAWDYGLNASDRATAVMTEVPATGITVTPDATTIAPGQKTRLKAAVEPADSTETEFTWTSADPSKVTVDAHGNLTGVAPSDGKPVDVIVASKLAPAVKAIAKVTVADVTDETGIAMAQDSATVEPGKTVDVAALVAPSLADEKVTWASSDEKVATVAAKDGNGTQAVVTAGEQVGTATITATVAGKSATMTVHVEPADFGQFVFDKDGTTLLGYTGNAADVVIPNNTKAIDHNAFANTQAVTITVPASVETIGSQAFAGAGKLTQVVFQNDAKHPSKLKSIGDEAFTDTLALDTVNLPVDAKDFTLGVKAFYSSTIRHVTLPASLTEIPDDAFGTDAQLFDVTISAGTTAIGDGVFSANISLGELKLVDASGTVTKGWPKKLKTIGNSAFSGTVFTGVIELPASVRTIGDNAFNLVQADIRLNDGLESIGATALSSSTGTELVMPDSLDAVGRGAFSNMPNLAKVTVGANVPDKALAAAFTGDQKLAEFTVPDSVKHYSVYGGVLFDKDRTTLVAYPNANAQGPADGVYTIPSETSSDGFGATVTDVAEYAFFANDSLKGVNFTEGLKTIGDSAFLQTQLAQVALPKSMETIAHAAFMNMANLTSVDFGGTVTVGGSAFYGDPVLTDLNMRPEYSRLKSFGRLAFGQSPSITKLDFPDSVVELGDAAFSNITALKEVHLGAGITSGVAGVFTGANGLTTITVSDKNPVYSATGNVLYQKKDDGLHLVLSAPGNPVTEYTVQDGTVAIEAQAFRNNHQLKRIVLPASLKTTTTGSFNSTDALTEVVFPDGFESTNSSFLFADALEYVEFGTKTKSINDEFWGHRPTHLVVRGGQDGTYTGGIIAGGMQTAYFGEGMTTINISDTPSIVVVPSDLKSLSLAGDGVVYAPAGSEGEKTAVAVVGADRVKAYTPLSLTANIEGEVKAGATVTVKAEAAGGVDGDKQYRFVEIAADGTSTVLQDWSDAAQATWTVPAKAGGAKVRVETRDATWYSVAVNATDGTLDAARAALADSLDAAKAVKQGDKVDSAWKTLQDAIAAAQKAHDDASATAGDLQQAAATLDDAVTAFEAAASKPSDEQRAALAQAIADAKAVTQGTKTDEAWKTLQDAIAAAEQVAGNTSGDLTAGEVDAATAALNAAVKAFRQSADKTEGGDNGGDNGSGGSGADGSGSDGSGSGQSGTNGSDSNRNDGSQGNLPGTGSAVAALGVFAAVCLIVAALATIVRARRRR
ncbi:leucine-rich repeat protein [Bifidobacterium aesculapii]|uniref:leucine-rich repeat protein n=1 Tax=Bifidobacterium aesculapii TaxID=1329411 RepID=UPI0006E256E9|nr:leucine-rich repeat protein [Bifidobacterium aesculapii]